MTFSEIVSRIAERLNLTSSDATARIGREVNDVYREITSSLGIPLPRRSVAVSSSTAIGYATVSFAVEKIERVIDDRSGTITVLPEVTYDVLRNINPAASDDPTQYAIESTTGSTVTIRLDAVAQSIYTLKCDGRAVVSDLSASDVPAFAISFHDVLIYGVLATEYRKMEKPALMQDAQQSYERRLGQLRYDIAKSGYLTLQQGGASNLIASSGTGSGNSNSGGQSYVQTGLITFDRDPSAPFAVTSGSAVVTNLDADLLDGQHGSYYTDLANATGSLGATQGGTGQTTVTQGDLLYGSAANTWSKLAKDGNATRYLSNTGTTNNPAWAQVALDTGVSGDLPFANLTQGSALSVLGVTGNATADMASIAASAASDAVLRESGSTLSFGTVATGGIANNAVTNGKIRQSGALAVVGRSANSTGDVADIQATAASDAVLRESGSTIGFGTIATAGITNAAVTLAKIANAAANSKLVGSGSAGSGSSYSEITLGSGLSMSGTTLSATAASVKPFLQWGAQGNNPPASAYATPDTRNSHAVLDFDGATDEEAVFTGVLPTSYSGGGLTIEIWVGFTSAVSGSAHFQAAIERMDVSSLDTDADSFVAFNESDAITAPATSGQLIKTTVTFTDGADMDSLAAGEAFRLKIRRDADGTGGTDNITTDAEVFRVVMRET